MEEEGIGMVLARASELRSKITNCIKTHHNAIQASEEVEVNVDPASTSLPRSPIEAGESEDGEYESLVNILDALESLEAQLSSLQALQLQQRYEREAGLAEIDYSRKILLKKLNEYKGEDLEVIHESSAFASETVEHNSDLLLPPYSTRPSLSLMLDNGFLSNFSAMRKADQNGIITSDPRNEAEKSFGESGRKKLQRASKNPWRGLGTFMIAAAKTVITLVGVVSVLSSGGFKPWLRKRNIHFKVLGLLQQPITEDKRSTGLCPPGKVLVTEDGETRCLVKERVEVPFESLVAKPDVNYGFG